MKKPLKYSLLLSAWLLVGLWASPSDAQGIYEKADSIAISLTDSYKDVAELAQQLTAKLDTEQEKARAIFMWIAHNVRYDCRKYHNPPKRPYFRAASKAALEAEVLEWREKQALKTMKSKRGVCADYSQLYKALCDESGLEAVVVVGNARDFHKPYRSAHNNSHAWNAVKLENKWYLLDATWGAGHADAAVKRFTRQISPGFFLSPPNWFSLNHFPNEEKWQLLEKPLSKEDFANQPVINYGQAKYHLQDFAVQLEDVAGKVNEKQIWLQFEDPPKELMITTRKRKPIPFKKSFKEGKVILTFKKPTTRSIIIFGGKSKRSRMTWLAQYEL